MRLLSLVLNSFIQAGTFIYSKKNNEIFKKICINIQNFSPTSVCTNEVNFPSNQIIHCWGQPLPYEPISFKNLTSLGIYHILKVNWTYMPIIVLKVARRDNIFVSTKILKVNLSKFSKQISQFLHMNVWIYFCIACKSPTSLVKSIFIFETIVFSKQYFHLGGWTQG